MERPPGAERGRRHCLPGSAEESSPSFLEGLARPPRPGLDAMLPRRPQATCLKKMKPGRNIPTRGLVFAPGKTGK